MDAPWVMLPLILALCLRLYPFVICCLPFSVDAWSSIKYAEILLGNSPISLNSEALRGCDELGDRLFGAAISALSGLKPITSMAFYLPFSGAISILVLYGLVKNIYGRAAAFTASMLLATAMPDVILTAGVKGETYAHPLYMALMLIFFCNGMGFWRSALLFSLVSTSLALTHYYTAILIAASLVSMGMAKLISRWRAGRDLESRILIFPSILAVTTFAYLTVYARWAFGFISSIDWLSAASYQLPLFALVLYLTLKPQRASRARTVTLGAVASLTALLLAFLTTKIALVPGAPILPMHYLLYACPFLIAVPLVFLAIRDIKVKINNNNDGCTVLPLFWLAVVVGLECYAVFGNVEAGLGLTLAYRGLVFLIPPLSILCATGLKSLLGDGRKRKRRFNGVGAIILSAILALNLYAFYATIFMQERYLGYFWLYRLPEYRAGSWLSGAWRGGTMACDVKFAYLLRQYFALKVDEFQGLFYLSGKASLEPDILLIYDQMFKNGYVVYGGYSVEMPGNWTGRVESLSLVYSNGMVRAYSGDGLDRAS